jgi:two-component system, CitB family, sensor kinase
VPRLTLNDLTLTRQLLILQLLLVVAVLGVVGAVGYAQATAQYRNTAGNRTLALAEAFATDRLVRSGLLDDPIADGVLAGAATRTQTVSGATYVLVTDPSGKVLTAQDPSVIDSGWRLSAEVREGRGWEGFSESFDGTAIEAQVPVLDPETADRIGFVVVGIESPGPLNQLRSGISNFLLYLFLASALGILGSVLLARRIKRQTLGLEPRDIAGLVEHREALLHGIREGVIGLDDRLRVTLVNDEAAELLALPDDAVGRHVSDLGLDPTLLQALVEPTALSDRVFATGNRLITVNQMPVQARGTTIGTVTTLRDRTELAGLQSELDVTRRTADSLRAQAHEFTNRLHTIAGLIHIKQTDRAIDYINGLDAAQQQVVEHVTEHVEDPTVAALLIAKVAVAQEVGVELVLSEESRLPEVSAEVAADLETIIGNFLDNAIEAVGRQSSPSPRIELLLRESGDRVEVRVHDSGPGIDAALLDAVFDPGVTTKLTERGSHGIGLSLAQFITRRRGGDVSAHNEGGAVFAAWFPVAHDSRIAGGERNDQFDP